MSIQLLQEIKGSLVIIASLESEPTITQQLQAEFQIYCANSKEEALIVLSQHTTELVLIEQKIDCDIVRSELIKHQKKVILLSPTPSFEEGLIALQQGYKGYGNLFSSKERLVAAINLVLAGDVWLGASVVEGLKQTPSSNEQSTDKSALERLTSKELSVAKNVVLGHSNKQIADSLHIAERTVKAHLTAVYEKLSIKNRTELILNYKNDL
ncbi:LuxR C-terminal-related transcriptional regulator [Litoribrevibacter euphylliae]|uniref:LuxR C-terminal-related transcriptional regulator n=1 Tax=Litoribrevibacter euphylliae TaxID=1834034 RepID=A0ABV7HAS9_9GAMM